MHHLQRESPLSHLSKSAVRRRLLVLYDHRSRLSVISNKHFVTQIVNLQQQLWHSTAVENPRSDYWGTMQVELDVVHCMHAATRICGHVKAV